MADLPFLTYATVTQTAKGLIGDTYDPGLDPDYFNVWVDVTITPRLVGMPRGWPLSEIRLGNQSPPVTILLTPFPARIESGTLRARRGNAPANEAPNADERLAQDNAAGVRILAQTEALELPEGALLVYDVTYGDFQIGGRKFRIQDFTFAAPTTDTTVDLTKVDRIDVPSGGSGQLLIRRIPDHYEIDGDGKIVIVDQNGSPMGPPFDPVATLGGGDGDMLAAIYDPAGIAANVFDRSNHTGTQSADTIVDGTTKKAFTAAERTKLANIAEGATANATNEQLRNRATHTGTQSASTISDFTEAVQDTVASTLEAGTRMSVNYDDNNGTITISTSATQNQSDAYLLSRANHTGTQSASTISDFDDAALNATKDYIDAAVAGAQGPELAGWRAAVANRATRRPRLLVIGDSASTPAFAWHHQLAGRRYFAPQQAAEPQGDLDTPFANGLFDAQFTRYAGLLGATDIDLLVAPDASDPGQWQYDGGTWQGPWTYGDHWSTTYPNFAPVDIYRIADMNGANWLSIRTVNGSGNTWWYGVMANTGPQPLEVMSLAVDGVPAGVMAQWWTAEPDTYETWGSTLMRALAEGFDPDLVVIALGANDLDFPEYINDVDDNLSAIIGAVRTLHPRADIALQTYWQPDWGVVRQQVLDTAEAEGVALLDWWPKIPTFEDHPSLYVDEYHLNATGHRVLADLAVRDLGLPPAEVDLDAIGVVRRSDTSTTGFQFVVNENNMASNSPTKVPTQASVKAYVDAKVSSGGGSGGGGGEWSTPLMRLRAGLSMRNSDPAPIVFVGSSTTAGQSASSAAARWVNRLMKALQDAYPLDSGSPSPATVTAIPGGSLPLGVQGINLGLSGGTSSDIVTTTAGARGATQIGDLNPVAVIWQPISNDFRWQVNPATVKANILTRLNQIDAAADDPVVHILFNTYARWDFTPTTYSADAYLEILREIAEEDPDNRIAFDLDDEFAAIGVGYSTDRSDWRSIMADVNVHMNNRGHAYLADLVLARLGFTLSGGSSSPVGDTTPPTAPTLTFVSKTATTVTVNVSGGTDDVGVVGYHVYEGATRKTTTPAAAGNYTVTGYSPESPYSITATAVDAASNESPASTAVTGTTDASGGPGGGPVEIIAQNNAVRLTSGDVISCSITVPTGSANRRMYAVFANSHSEWVPYTDYDTYTVVSSVDGAFSMVEVSSVDAARSNGPSGQRSGSVAFFVLDSPSEGAHTITATIADSASANTQLLLYVFCVENCAGEADLIVTGNDTQVSSTSTGPVASADDHLVVFAHLSTQNPTLTGGATQLYKDGAAVGGYGDYLLVAYAPGASSVGPITTSLASAGTNSRIAFDLVMAD